MKRASSLLFVAYLSACGVDVPPEAAAPSVPSEPFVLSLGALPDEVLHVRAGETTWVPVLVLNGGAGAFTFEGLGLPPFVTLAANGRLSLEPSADLVGQPFSFTVRAHRDGQSTSLDVHVFVDPPRAVPRPNTPPTLVTPSLSDLFGGGLFKWTDNDCVGTPHLIASGTDLDRDDVGLEIVATPRVQNPGSRPSIRYQLAPVQTEGFDGTHFTFTEPQTGLTGLTPGVSYAITARALDARGAMSEWLHVDTLTCYPFGVAVQGQPPASRSNRIITLHSGVPQSVPLEVVGLSEEPVVLSAWNLPPYADFDGRTLTFHTPTTPRNSSSFMILAQSGAWTSRATFQLYIDDAP